MIFNKDYDRTLSLILDGDKENRGQIASFINQIPEDMYNSMVETLVLYGVYKNVCTSDGLFDTEIIKLSETFRKEDSVYSYKINLISGALEIEYTFIFDNRLINKVKLVLYPVTLDECRTIGKIDSIHLGSLCDSYIDKECEYADNHNITSFDLTKKTFNNYFLSSYDFNSDRSMCYRVNLSELSDNLDLCDLKDIHNIKKLIRSKKGTR